MNGRSITLLVMLISAMFCNAANYSIFGSITDEDTGTPIEDASVSFKIKGKLYTAMSDSLGNYRIYLPDNSRFVLKISHISYQPKTKLIIPQSNDIREDFVLTPKDNTLNEVVVSANASRVHSEMIQRSILPMLIRLILTLLLMI